MKEPRVTRQSPYVPPGEEKQKMVHHRNTQVSAHSIPENGNTLVSSATQYVRQQ